MPLKKSNLVSFEKTALLIILSSVLMVWSITLLRNKKSNAISDKINTISKELIAYHTIQYKNDAIYMRCINVGFKHFTNGNYNYAQELFYKAYSMKPSEYLPNYLLAQAYYTDCAENNEKCASAQQSIESLHYNFPEEKENTYFLAERVVH
jgi:hypothetical protein